MKRFFITLFQFVTVAISLSFSAMYVKNNDAIFNQLYKVLAVYCHKMVIMWMLFL